MIGNSNFDGNRRGVVSCLMAVGFALTALGHAETIITQPITANTTWTKAGSPYRVNLGLSVAAGATLTIEPGVEVQFERFMELQVNGILRAIGSAAAPITLTGTVKTPGWWSGVSIIGKQEKPLTGSILEYVTVEYTGYDSNNLYVQYATVTARNCVFRNSTRDGVYGAVGAVALISDSTFTANQGYALWFGDQTSYTLLNLKATGNRDDGVAVRGGQQSGTMTWEASGLPYIVQSSWTVERGARLVIRPGVEVRFEKNAQLWSFGTLQAVGARAAPILLTGTNKTAGWWNGVVLQGTAEEPDTGSVFDYVTLEYGGAEGASGANLFLSHAQISISHSIIRNSRADGIRMDNIGGLGVSSTIDTSQIVSNAGFGVLNLQPVPETVVMAGNNWWGDPSGPTVGSGCNQGGRGSRVSSGVIFRPFLRQPDADPSQVDPSGSTAVSLLPERWFVPADGSSRAWVTVVVRDGAGGPLPGRRVRLNSTLGEVTDGGFTNVRGESLAFVTSAAPGDAQVTARLDTLDACETASSAPATIAFTPAVLGGDLLPGNRAPYVNPAIEVQPEPVTQGVPSEIRITLENPGPQDLLVEGDVEYADFGIGSAFGPVGRFPPKRVPRGGTAMVVIPWTPPVTGHYCFRVRYSATVDPSPDPPPPPRRGEAQMNVSAGEKPGGPKENDLIRWASQTNIALTVATLSVESAHLSFEVVEAGGSKFVPAPTLIPEVLLETMLHEVEGMWNKAANELAGIEEDPPRLDYRIIAVPERITFPPFTPPAGMSTVRSAAINGLLEAALDKWSKMSAAFISWERLGGAASAGEQTWAALQRAALDEYKKQAGAAMVVYANRLEDYMKVLTNEGVSDVRVDRDEFRAALVRLRTRGFSTSELEAARRVKLTDEDLAYLKQLWLSTEPEDAPVSLWSALKTIAAAMRAAGESWANPPGISQIVRPAAKSERSAEQASPALVWAHGGAFTFKVGNPLPRTETIDLRVRRLGMPPNWTVNLNRNKLTLAPGETGDVRANVLAVTPAVPGERYEVAVEGYVRNEMIGGVLLRVAAPQVVPFSIGPAPRVASGGVANGASFSPAIAPGSLFSVFGLDLANTTERASATPLPSTLGGVSISVNGRFIPLLFAGPGQINAQLPYETPPGRAMLTVWARGVASGPVPVDVIAAAPGIFQWGDHRAVVQNQDFTLNTPDHPAIAGGVVVAYLTGQGALDIPVVTGMPSPGTPLSHAALAVTATLGGKPADVLFAGLAPGFVGLLQVNLKVPDLIAGDHPLTVTIDGVASNPALVSVSARTPGLAMRTQPCRHRSPPNASTCAAAASASPSRL